MSIPIPEWALKIARDIILAGPFQLQHNIALALMVEAEAADERAANIVTEWEKTMVTGERLDRAFANVASAIRDRTKP